MASENLYGKIQGRLIYAPVQIFHQFIFMYQFDKELQPFMCQRRSEYQHWEGLHHKILSFQILGQIYNEN